MAIEKKYISDVEAILSHRYDNGADYWTTPDKRLIKGSPFSMLDSILYLLELGMEPTDPLLKECANRIFSAWREDGEDNPVQEDTLMILRMTEDAFLWYIQKTN
ncbi:MAG: hypothetical protein ACERKN_21775 [Velocimicrobium sp.]